MSDDEKVKNLSPSDPLNIKLAGFQVFFGEIHEYLLQFIDDAIDTARSLDFTGLLDAKVSTEGGKLVLRRNLRKRGQPAPKGKFWALPVDPETLHELKERLKPAPPEEETPADTEVDASAEPSAPAPRLGLDDLLRSRAREAAALAGNIRRTQDAIRAAGRELEGEDEIVAAMSMLEAALEAAADRMSPQ